GPGKAQTPTASPRMSRAARAPAAPAAGPRSKMAVTDRRKWLVVVAMSGVMVLLTLDFFGLTVALPRIGEDLKASTSSLLWVINGYLLLFAAPIIAVGRLADIVGRRKVVLVGIVIFVAGSALCTVAQS